MTLHVPQCKAASVGSSASIGPTPKTGGKEVPALKLALPSESIRALRLSLLAPCTARRLRGIPSRRSGAVGASALQMWAVGRMRCGVIADHCRRR
jgi:hypothetical protein